MMKCKLIFFGKPKDITEREKELAKRIGFRVNFEMICLPQAGVKEDKATILKKEAELLEQKIGDKECLIVLDERGQDIDSVQFATKVQKMRETYGDITFVIGGAYGIAEEIQNRAVMKLAMSKMVWTKDLARLMLLEQLYRAGEIQAGTGFHKI